MKRSIKKLVAMVLLVAQLISLLPMSVLAETVNTPAARPAVLDTAPAGEQPADGEPADGEPADGEPADGEPADGEPADGEPANGEPADGTPADGEPADGEPANGEPADGEPADEERDPIYVAVEKGDAVYTSKQLDTVLGTVTEDGYLYITEINERGSRFILKVIFNANDEDLEEQTAEIGFIRADALPETTEAEDTAISNDLTRDGLTVRAKAGFAVPLIGFVYAEPAEEPADGEPVPEEPALPPLMMSAGPRLGAGEPDGGDSEITPEKITEKIIAAYYPNGEYYNPDFPNGQIALGLSGGPASGEKVLAGSSFNYSISYGFNAAPTWEEGWNPYASLFDSYTDISLSLTLPPELVLSRSDNYAFETETLADGSHKYTFTNVPSSVSSAASSSGFTVTIQVAGNGTENATVPVQISTDALEFTASYTLLNKAYPAGDPNRTLETFTETKQAGGQTIERYSPDKWLTAKSTVGDPVLDRTTHTATVIYRVEVGLTDMTDPTLMLYNDTAYQRSGRNVFDTATLKDTLSTAIVGGPYDGQTLSLVSENPIAIRKDSVSATTHYYQAADLTAGIDILNTEGLEINKNINVDSDIDPAHTADMPVATYTVYYVTATYVLTDDIMDQFDAADTELKFNNTATLNYKLHNMNADGNTSTATHEADMPVIDPAHFSVTKQLLDYTGTTGVYGNKYGPIAFTLTAKDASGAAAEFKLYQKENGTYVPVTGDEPGVYSVYLNRTYYMQAGLTYHVEEALDEATQSNMVEISTAEQTATHTFTAEENQGYEPFFVNEEQLGMITIDKKDSGTGFSLAGAKFVLYKADGVTPYNETVEASTVTTDQYGKAYFEEIPFGNYVLKETEPPADYAIDPEVGDTFRITIAAGAQGHNITVVSKNKKTAASITLTKKGGTFEATPTAVSGNTAPWNTNLFTLERSLDGTTWETVAVDTRNVAIPGKVDTNGKIQVTVPSYDANGYTYTYRFKENIPTGWYDPSAPGQSVTYSKSVQLVNGDAPADQNVEIINRRKVQVTVYKKHYDATAAGGAMTEITTEPVDVKLYKSCSNASGATMTPVDTKQAKGTEATAAKFTDLPCYEWESGAEKRVYYYVCEDDIPGYQLDVYAKQTVNATSDTKVTAITGADGKKYYPVSVIGVENTVNFYNVEQKVPSIIYKKNYYTKNTDFISGCKVTVTDVTDPNNKFIATDAETGTGLENVEILSADGLMAYLQPGHKYEIVETAWDTEHYHPKNATAASPLVLDLTSVVVDYAHRNNLEVKTATVKNAPDVRVKILKRDKTTEAKNDDTAKAQFTAYTYDETIGKYVKYLDEDNNPIVITGNNTDYSGVKARFEPGKTYYFAETKVPDGYLDPSVFTSLYTGSAWTVGITDTGVTYNFYKTTINDSTTNATDNYRTLTIDNIPNKGSVKVKKYVDGSVTSVTGFEVLVKDPSGNIAKDAHGNEIGRATTDGNGEATITGLPVYDAAGNQIVYTIEEGTLASSTYYKAFDGQTTELTLNTTTTTANASSPVDPKIPGNTLHISNETKTELSATKWYRHTWEYEYTKKSYPMEGVTFGLFMHDTENGKWVKVEGSDLVTGPDGKINYEGLRRDADYAVVELAGPDPLMFPYDEDGVNEKDYAGDITEISEADLSKYNVLIKDAYSTDVEIGDLYNQDRWVQFDIDKWLDKEVYDPDGTITGTVHDHDTAIDFDNDVLCDDAVFRMYRYAVPAGTTNVVFDPDTWELMGTYTSGSAYWADGSRAAGKFMTGVDQKAAENVVYMLVEINAGVGGRIINPNFKYTFYQHEDASYSVSGTGTYTPRNVRYDFGYNWDDVLNSRVSGSGDGGLMVAALRLAKWKDSFDDEGVLKQDYEPLGNVDFDLILDETNETLETLTTGLNPDPSGAQDASRAWAQSAPLLMTKKSDGEGGFIFTLRNYSTDEEALDDDTTGRTVHPVELESTATYTVYGLPITLVETNVPNGFNKGVGEYHCYLCFVETSRPITKVYNDSYYVTSDDPEAAPLAQDQWGTAWKVTAADGASYPFSTIERAGGGTFRIVDYPTQHTIVRIEKYGYTPTAATVGKTADDLDDMTLTNKTALSGVKLTLQHLDESVTPAVWEWWNPNTAVSSDTPVYFTTRSDGSFVVNKGLPIGTYRVLEAASQDSSLSAYEFIYSKESVGGRTFKVGNDYKVVTMYNPKKVNLSITKKDTKGNTVALQGFALDNLDTGKRVYAGTGSDGVARFINLDSGKYSLLEDSNLSTLSIVYLKKYIDSLNNPELTALVNGGTLVGYTHGMSTKINGDGLTEVVVTGIGLGNADFAFEVVNPDTVKLKVRKVDQETGAGLSGATFKITRKEFTSWSGENAITTNGSWTSVVSTATTSTDGWYENTTGYRPAVYRFQETAAPAGYDILKDINGNTVYFYLVLTGGMPVTVKKGTGGLPETATVLDADGNQVTVQTLFIDPTGDVEFQVPNRKKVTLSAQKNVLADDSVKPSLEWTVTLDIYDAASNGNKVGTVKLTQADTEAKTFKVSTGTTAADALFSTNKTYYLQETVNSTPASDYKVHGVKIGTADATLVGSRYAIPVTGTDEISISVTNRYMRGSVTFEKLDQKDLEQEDLRTLLKGASFTVEWPDGTPVTGASVMPIYNSNNEETGRYYADIPMMKKDGTYPADDEEITVIIRETDAPTHYVLQDGKTLTVTLKPTDPIKDWTNDVDPTHYITNSEGWTLKILKLNNIPGSADPQPVKDHSVEFEAYQLGENGKYARYQNAKQTDENGYVTWTLLPGNTYAFYESNWDSDKFTGIHSAERFVAGGSNVPVSLTEIELADGSKIKAFVIGAVNTDLEYWAYNVPTLSVKFIKEDVGGYPVGVIPNTHFKVYEVDSLPTTAAGYLAAIEALTDDQVVFQATTGSASGETEGYTTYKIWNRYDPTKNYIAVEDGVGAKTTGVTYNTLNKADDRVVWYVGIAAGENTDPTVVIEKTFKNVYGDADVALEKAVVNHDETEDLTVRTAADTDNASVGETVDSLLKGSRKVVFELTPTVTTNNSALSTFTVSDTGIKFFYKNSAGTEVQAADGTYSITKITIGKASHDVSHFIGDAGTGAISARVTWTLADGTATTSTVTGISNDAVSVSAPAGAQSFVINYYSTGVQGATNNEYNLGWDFTAEPVTVYATLNQQPDGTEASPVNPITTVKNASATELTYTRWNADGSRATQPWTKTDKADATLHVAPLEYPVPSITKSTAAETAIPGDVISYTLTVRNNSKTENFIDPVIVDTMPLGMTLVGTPVVSEGSAGETLSLTSIERMTGATVTAAGETETAFALKISGTLLPESTFTVTFQGVVSENAVIYGDKLMNFAFLSSSASSYHTADNPKGYSFRNADGSLPYTMPVEAGKNLPEEDGTMRTCVDRVEDLKNALGEYYTDKYIYVKSYANIGLNTSDTMTLSKSIRGDQDPTFSAQDGFLATATRNNSTPAAYYDQGYVEYILGCVNGTNLDKIGIAIGDAISKIGDKDGSSSRGTKWDTEFDYIESVQFGGMNFSIGNGEGHYRLYVYRGDAANADAAVKQACADNTNWYGEGGSAAKAWPIAGAPSGWEELTSGSCYDPDITAFVIVFGIDNILEEGQSIYIKYHTRVEDIPTEEEWEAKGFQNANNRAHLNFVNSFLGDMKSNPVACVLMDKTVLVAGDLWIDEDQTGVQKQPTDSDYHGADYFLQWNIIRTLADNFKASISDERQNPTGSGEKDTESVWDGVGQSLVHFGFKDIGAASAQFSNLYDEEAEELNVGALKTTDPYVYAINASMPSSLANVIKLTEKGELYYKSVWTGSAILDSNFIENGNAYTFRTKKFFVSYENGNDHTKDIGVILNRNLDIFKVADDDPAFKVKGATFKIYGPYAEGGATAISGNALKFTASTDASGKTVYTVDPNGSVTELVTGDNGELHIVGLNWFKEYIIKETNAADGFKLEGATATGDGANASITELSGEDQAWVLSLPKYDATTPDNTMTVENVRDTTVVISADKEIVLHHSVSDISKEGFEFSLYEVKGEDENFIETIATDENGHVDFTALTYSKAGTYEYKIREVIPTEKKPGVTYSTEPVKVIVSVTWDTDEQEFVTEVTYYDANGNIIKNANDEAADAGVITNDYEPGPTELDIPAKKAVTYTVAPDPNAEFTFVLAPVTTGAPMPSTAVDGKVSITVKDGEIKYFGKIDFTDAGVYEYTVTELEPAEEDKLPGYTYDTTPKNVKVTVSENTTTAMLEVSWTVDGQTADNVLVTNTYTVTEAEAELPAKKVITGQVPPETKTFTFELVPNSETPGAPMPADAVSGKATLTVTGAAEGKFGKITYTQPGTYKYDATEVDRSADDDYKGYTFSTSSFTYVVTVEDQGGELTASWTVDGKSVTPEFENTYIPEQTSAPLYVEKLIDGTVPKTSKQFTMQLTAVDGAPMPASYQDVIVTGTATGCFGTITYTEAGTYEYEVTEVDKSADSDYTGYSFDPDTHYVSIKVEDRGGQLALTEAKVDGETVDLTKDPIRVEITNRYDPEPAKIELPVVKNVTGHERTQPKTFEFTITADASNPENVMPEKATIEITVARDTTTGSKSFIFPDDSFAVAGDYKYTVKEVVYSGDHYVYDTTEYAVTVSVKDVDGTLEATWTSVPDMKGKPMSFTNEYKPTPATQILPVKKQLTGKATPTNKPFVFVLTGENSTTPMPENATDGKATVTITGAGTGAFEAIAYDTAGTYTYTVVETQAASIDYTGYTFDTTTYTVVVTVVDDNGELKASYAVTDAEECIFVNDYTPSSDDVIFPVKKVVTGNETPSDAEFSFVLTPGSTTPDAPMPADAVDGKATVTVTGSAETSFTKIDFDTAGIYYYDVKEIIPDPPVKGYVYDEATHTYTVTVTDQGGELEATWVVDGDAQLTEPTFTNVYAPTALVIPVEKQLTGNPTPADKPFVFTLTGEAGDTPMPADAVDGVATVTIVGANKSAFGAIIYEKAGEYRYTVVEKKAENVDYTGYDFDTTTYTVVVTVEDKNGDGQLFVSYDVVDADECIFVNKYIPEPDEIIIPVKKTVEGPVPDGCDKTFTFDIVAVTKDAPMPAGDSFVTVPAGQTVNFGAIEFTAAGEYVYTVTERDQSADPDYVGYTFDTAPRTVTVTVVDNDGTLEATWASDPALNENGELEFVNTYMPIPVPAVIHGFKILKNLELKEDMFEFELLDADKKVIEVKRNTADGDIRFTEMLFTEVGTHTFYIKERVGEEAHMVYDTAVREVTITITDDNGTLVADVTPVTKLTFINRWEPWIPRTGYGEDMDWLLYILGAMSLAALICALPKKRKRKEEE